MGCVTVAREWKTDKEKYFRNYYVMYSLKEYVHQLEIGLSLLYGSARGVSTLPYKYRFVTGTGVAEEAFRNFWRKHKKEVLGIVYGNHAAIASPRKWLCNVMQGFENGIKESGFPADEDVPVKIRDMFVDESINEVCLDVVLEEKIDDEKVELMKIAFRSFVSKILVMANYGLANTHDRFFILWRVDFNTVNRREFRLCMRIFPMPGLYDEALISDAGKNLGELYKSL